jgi:hypothetical protein
LVTRLEEKKLDTLFNQHVGEINKVYEKEGKFDDVYFRYNFEIYETLLSYMATKGIFDKDAEIKCFFFLISHCIILSLKMNQDLIAGATSSRLFDYKNTLLFNFTEKFDIESFIEEIKNIHPIFTPF